MISRLPEKVRSSAEMSRRSFLITMLGTGVVLGYARSPLNTVGAVISPNAGSGSSPAELFLPTIWYGIDRSGTVTINVIRAEMGQHVGTALARIVADELEADWNKVRVITVDSAAKWGNMITGGSWSVWQAFPVLSRAGAAGRIALIEEGAKLLGVPTHLCTARNGTVKGAERSIPYGDIVSRGNLRRTFTAEQLQRIQIKSPVERRL